MPEDTTSRASLSVAEASQKAFSLLAPDESRDEQDTQPEPPPEDVGDEQDQQAPEHESLDQAPETTDEGVPDDEGDGADLHTVIIGGETLQVPYDELVRGYQRTGDYTRKTQAVAEERRQAVSERERLQTARTLYAERLQAMDELLDPGEEPDWAALRKESPEQYAVAHADYQRRQEQRRKVKEERERVGAEAEADRQQAMTEVVHREYAALVSALPHWKDDTKRVAEQRALAEYGRSIGFSDEELANTVDHRALLLLRKAMLFDRGAQRVKVAEKQGKRTKTLRPGRGGREKAAPDAIKQKLERARQTGTVSDAAAAVLAMIEKKGPT